MVDRRTVLCLGLSQLLCWGISYYLIGAFGETIGADLGWSPSVVYGGFSAALGVMGLVSAPVGRLIDRRGGRRVMATGSVLLALGCAGLALAHDLWLYFAAWAVMGLAMRMTLYDAAFAALARIGGPYAKGPISQITLLGGLASTVLWPIGHALIGALGWRGALFAYAVIALATLPLHLAIPERRFQAADAPPSAKPPARPLTADGGARFAAIAYALIVALTTFLNSGMSAHMIGILTGIGVAASVAVWIGALRGIGQSISRFGEVLFGARIHPFTLSIGASALLPVCFIAGLFGGAFPLAAIAFAFVYGAGNGLLTIVRGTLPLVLFDHQVYGSLVGRLLAPSFYLSALAPLAYALVIEHLGDAAALWLSAAIGAAILLAGIALRLRFRG